MYDIIIQHFGRQCDNIQYMLNVLRNFFSRKLLNNSKCMGIEIYA